MPLFTKVCLRCNVCGESFLTTFMPYDGRFCSQECCEEYDLRRATAVVGIDDPLMQQPYRKPKTEG